MKDRRGYSAVPFLAALILATIVISSVFTVIIPSMYDFKSHNNYAAAFLKGLGVQSSGITVTYVGYHLLVYALSAVTKLSINLTAAWVMTAAAVSSCVIYRKILRHELREYPGKEYVIDAVSVFSVFIGTIPSVLTGGIYYKYVLAANVWHNPTLPFMRPLGIIMVWYYVIAVRNIKDGRKDTKHLVKFSIITLLCVFAKPSGIIAIGPIMIIYTLVVFAKNVKARFLPCLKLLIFITPTLFYLFVMAMIQNVDGGVFEIMFYIGTPWNISAEQGLKYLLSASAFGLVVLPLAIRSPFENEMYGVTLLGMLSAAAQYYFIAEGGPRFSHGNFGWGYVFMLNLFLVFSFIPLLKKKSRVLIGLMTAVFAVHAAFGIKYLGGTINGLHYWR